MDSKSQTLSYSDDLVDFLSQPSAYPSRPREVRLRETHISWVFLTGSHAFKLKKPLLLDFLDFSTADLRRQACEAELALNRRFAPHVYLDVVPVVRNTNGSFSLGPANRKLEPVDWVVKMRQLDDAQTLERMIQRSASQTGDGDYESQAVFMAKHLARFYASQAPVTLRTAGFRDGIRSHVDDNLACLLELATSQAEADTTELVHSFQVRFLTICQDLIDNRVRDGRVVDGHGDLRPEHIYLCHPPVVIDCIEFNTGYRTNDIIDELAFLAMECDRLGATQVGPRLFEAYIEESGDVVGDKLVAFYKTYRACVRAKVASIRSQQHEPHPTDSAHATVRSYLSLASGYISGIGRPLIIMVGGGMGTGKSTLARRLAERLGGRVVSSDEIRQADGKAETRPEYGEAHYTLEQRLANYHQLMRSAARELRRSATVIIDASFTTRAMRHLAKNLADLEGAQLIQIECVCPRQSAADRIAARTAGASEARADLIDQQAAEREAPLATFPYVTIDTTQATGQQDSQALETITTVLHSEGAL